MKNKFKILGLAVVFVMGISLVTFKVDANETIQGTGLKDYIAANKGNKKGLTSEDIKLSKESLNIYSLANKDKLNSSKQKNLDNIIVKTNEKLWFIIGDNGVEGMVVANKKVPIKMGGKNRSIELKALYDNLKEQGISDKEIKYLEIRGQGVLIISDKDEVYLTKGSSQLLGLEDTETLSTEEFIESLSNLE